MSIENAISRILQASPPFRKCVVRIEDAPVGKEQDGQYVERPISYLMVPVIAVSILGLVDADRYFPRLPITGALANSHVTRGAQFSFDQFVVAVRTLLGTTVPIQLSDIMRDPRGTGGLYFSERLQNGLLDGILHQYPQLYQSVREWLHSRYEQEKHHWNLTRRGVDLIWNRNTTAVLNPALAIPDPYAAHMPLPSEVIADPSPCMGNMPLPSPVSVPTNMKHFLSSMTARANRILKQTNPRAAASGLAAEPLPRTPRKRPRTPPGASAPPAMPKAAARARHREQREAGDGGLPTVPLTEYQLAVMVNRLHGMPGPASFRNTTLLPPTDDRLAENQQFLRDYLALGLELPPASAPTVAQGSMGADMPMPAIPILAARDPQLSPQGSPSRAQQPPINVYTSPDRLREAKRMVARIERRSMQQARSEVLAARDVEEHFASGTDAEHLRNTLIRDLQPLQQPTARERGTNLMRDAAVPALEQPPPPFGAGMRSERGENDNASLVHNRNRVRDTSRRAEALERRRLTFDDGMMPEVTDAASLTMNVVFDAVLQSIPKSMRNLSRDRLKNTESAADALLRRQAAKSYQPGLAESPPESFPLESIHFEPEAQGMQSHAQQVAAEVSAPFHRLSLGSPVPAAGLHRSDAEAMMAIEAIVMDAEPAAASGRQAADASSHQNDDAAHISESHNDSESGSAGSGDGVRRRDRRVGRQRHRPGQTPCSRPRPLRRARRILYDSDELARNESSADAADSTAMDVDQPLSEVGPEAEDDSEESSSEHPSAESRGRARRPRRRTQLGRRRQRPTQSALRHVAASAGRGPAPAQPAAPRGPAPARPAEVRPAPQLHVVPDHPGFITDDRERWPLLHDLGPIDQPDQHCKGCGAAHWFEERTQKDQAKGRETAVTFSACCRDNSIRLPPVSDPFPEELKALFTGEGDTYHGVPVTRQISRMFTDSTRAINNKLAFACISNTNQDKKINESRHGHTVPWVYKIHGQTYRYISPAQARTQDIAAQYSQLYFRDVSESLDTIRAAFEANDVLQSIVQNTHVWLREHNPYAQTYLTLREIIDQASLAGVEVPLYSIQFNQHKNLDPRTYNVPSIAQTEVAAILLGEHSRYDCERTLTVTSRYIEGHDNFTTIKCTTPQTDPLCYPLLNPRGTLGWHYEHATWHGPEPAPEPAQARRQRQPARNRYIDDMAEDSQHPSSSSPSEGEYGQERPRRRKKKTKWERAKKMSMLDFFAYRMHWRKVGVHPNNKFDPLFWARRLFQQYTVDAFSKVEENRLNQLRQKDMQTTLRAENYDRLQEYINEAAHERGVRPGKAIVLPSTFSGSSRHMAQEYADAMAIVRKKGHNGLDYFITMTANPKWAEVQASLPRDEHGHKLQEAIDRPDIVARVFKLKMDSLLKDLFEDKIFGQIAGYAWTVEYQVEHTALMTFLSFLPFCLKMPFHTPSCNRLSVSFRNAVCHTFIYS